MLVGSAAAAAKSLQSCSTLCDPIDSSPPGSPVPGILQARTLEWVAVFFSNAWKWKVKVKSLSRVRPLVTLWTAAFQALPSMGFSKQEYWSGVPLPSPLVGSNEQEIATTLDLLVRHLCVKGWKIDHTKGSGLLYQWDFQGPSGVSHVKISLLM